MNEIESSATFVIRTFAKMKAWFESWFCSPYYHILYKERDEKEAQFFLDKLIDLLQPRASAKILDAGCGKGRHSIYLNKKGFDVCGFDLSKVSIKHNKEFENRKLKFFVHDMRKIFQKNNFDFVFNLFSSFGYFDDERDNGKTISAHAHALKPNGILVLDYMNSKMISNNLKAQEIKTIQGIKFTVNKKIENKKIIKEISFTDKGHACAFEERLSIFSLQDFEKLFSPSHLQIKNVFGDYSLNPFDENNSERLILIAEKTR